MTSTKWMYFSKPKIIARFWRDRALRVAPLYWLFTLLSISVYVIAPSLTSAEVSIRTILGSFLFLPLSAFPIVKVGWTLNYEFYFYAIFGLLLAFKRSVFFWAFPLFAAISIYVAQQSTPNTSEWSPARFFSSPLLFEFYGGCLVAGVLRLFKISTAAANFCIFIALASYIMSFAAPRNMEYRLLLWGAPSALMCLGVAAKAEFFKEASVASKLGDASYSIYLSHPFFMPILGIAVKHSGLGLGTPLYALFGTVALAITGVLVYTFIERPITSYMKAQFSGYPSSTVHPA